VIRLFSITLLASTAMAAQAVEVSGSVGTIKTFLDEPAEFAFGGSLRLPLMRRLGVRPEFIATRLVDYKRYLAIVSATWDFTDAERGVVGYLVGGAGILYTRDKRIFYSTRTTTALGGVGVRFQLPAGLLAGGEIRFGNAAFPLATFSIGYRFGGR
jgi:hypothetical protein